MVISDDDTRPFARLSIAACVLAFAAAFSCKTFDVPGEICDPLRLDAKRLHGEAADGECTRCLEDQCCDKVGVCERKDKCPEIVSGVHECVLAADLQGAAVEAKCASDRGLANAPEANDAYRCMRGQCGNECGLPVCRVDQAAVLLLNPSCDRCFSSSCCPQLNACYASRACKLTLECIERECRGSLGQSLVDARKNPNALMAPDGGAGGPGADDAARICGAAPPPEFIAPECVRNCLCQFRENDRGLAPTEELRPLTLALRVYECGAKADCGPSCVVPKDAGAE